MDEIQFQEHLIKKEEVKLEPEDCVNEPIWNSAELSETSDLLPVVKEEEEIEEEEEEELELPLAVIVNEDAMEGDWKDTWTTCSEQDDASLGEEASWFTSERAAAGGGGATSGALPGYAQPPPLGGATALGERARRPVYSCSVCFKTFVYKGALVTHMRLHPGGKPFTCAVCGEAFVQRQQLERHALDHTEIKNYPCPVCPKIFPRKGVLNNHMLVHKEKTTFARPVSEKSTQTACFVKRVRIKTGQILFACSVCEKTFARREHLDRHIRMHTGEKSFACTVCEKSFARREHLHRHMLIHTKEKNYACTTCTKTFARKDNLNVHMRTHLRIPSAGGVSDFGTLVPEHFF